MKCECHERDSSYTCDACKEEGYFGHMETHLEQEWYDKRIKKAKEFNRKVAEFRQRPESTGCVGALGCEHCGELNYGTCMCMGIFTCERCGEKNDVWKIPEMQVIDNASQWYIDNSPQKLLEQHLIERQELIDEAKSIIDSEDGHEELLDFVLRIAGMDGDEEYQ